MARGSIIKTENKNGSITYYIKYRDPSGKQIKKAIGPRKRDAEHVLTETARKLHRGEYQKPSDVYFSELSKKWLKLKRHVRPKTFEAYKSHIDLRLNPAFGNIKIRQIKQEIIEEFMSELNSSSLSPSTRKRTLTILKSILRKAVEWGYLSRNPAEFVKSPKQTKVEMSFIGPKGIGKLIKITDDWHRALILTACYTGMRAGELLGLKWEDIDFEENKISVKRTLQQKKFYEPKSPSSKRIIIVPPIVIESLRQHKVLQSLLAGECELIFTNQKGKPINYRNFLMRVFKKALKEAGIKEIRFHDLRHSYAAALISSGENIKFIQKQLGHSSIKQTLDVYGHLLGNIEKEAPERLSKVFGTTTVLQGKTIKEIKA